MSGELYLLLAIGIVVAFWLLTAGSDAADRSRRREIERALREGADEIEAIYERGARRLDEATRRR